MRKIDVFLISRRLVVGTFPVCHPLRLMPTPRCKFTPLRSSIWRCARLALLCLLALAAGFLRAEPRQRAKCLRATWRGLQPSRPASGLRTRMRAGAGDSMPLLGWLSGSVQHSTHQHSTHPRSAEQRDPPE